MSRDAVSVAGLQVLLNELPNLHTDFFLPERVFPNAVSLKIDAVPGGYVVIFTKTGYTSRGTGEGISYTIGFVEEESGHAVAPALTLYVHKTKDKDIDHIRRTAATGIQNLLESGSLRQTKTVKTSEVQ